MEKVTLLGKQAPVRREQIPPEGWRALEILVKACLKLAELRRLEKGGRNRDGSANE